VAWAEAYLNHAGGTSEAGNIREWGGVLIYVPEDLIANTDKSGGAMGDEVACFGGRGASHTARWVAQREKERS